MSETGGVIRFLVRAGLFDECGVQGVLLLRFQINDGGDCVQCPPGVVLDLRGLSRFVGGPIRGSSLRTEFRFDELRYPATTLVKAGGQKLAARRGLGIAQTEEDGQSFRLGLCGPMFLSGFEFASMAVERINGLRDQPVHRRGIVRDCVVARRRCIRGDFRLRIQIEYRRDRRTRAVTNDLRHGLPARRLDRIELPALKAEHDRRQSEDRTDGPEN